MLFVSIYICIFLTDKEYRDRFMFAGFVFALFSLFRL